MPGLTLKDYSEAKGFNLETLTKLGVKDDMHSSIPAVAIPYYDPKGKFLFYRHRLALSGKMKFHQPAGTPLTMYFMQFLDTYDPSYIIVVEGESDAQTLIQHGLQAIGLPGAGSWKEDFVPLLAKFSTVYVVKEPDQGGETLLKKLTESKLADHITVLGLGDCKDVSELYLADREGFVDNLRSFIAKATDLIPSPFKTLEQLMAEDLGPVEWGIDGLLPCGGFTAFAGAPGSYKTWLMLEAMIAIASGTPYLGKFPTKQAPVMLLDNESGPRILQTRLKELLTARGLPLDLPIHWVSFTKYTLEDMTFVYRQAKRLHIRHVFVDSFVRFLGGFDENTSNEIAQAFQNINMFKADNISFNFIHHNRKAGIVKSTGAEEMRGSSDILASLHSLLSIEFNSKKQLLTINHNKSREAEPQEPFTVNIDKENGLKFQYAGGVDEMRTMLEEVKDAIVAILDTKWDKIPRADLFEGVKQAGATNSDRTYSRGLKDLILEGKIKEAYMPGNKRMRLYYIPREEEEDESENTETLI